MSTTTAPVFTPANSAVLLAYVAGVDSRFETADAATASIRERTWATILCDVPPDFALSFARRYYGRPQEKRLDPGTIRGAWLAEQTRVQTATAEPLHEGVPMPKTLSGYLRDVLDALKAGRAPESVPRPETARRLGHAQDLISRRCRYWTKCACSHETCRDGWLDVEEVIIGNSGLTYPAVRACPHCHDAAVMAAELRPTRGRGGR